MKNTQMISGQYVDVYKKEIYPAELSWKDGIITSIIRISEAPKRYICPGFIDSHIHIESSMLCPSRFAAEAIKHGTIGTVSDPHEIANVLGEEGILYMLEDAKKVPFHFYFGVPSCVPATGFETAGAVLDSEEVGKLLERNDLHYLSEMMNYPGVMREDDEVMRKVAFAHKIGKPVDGHAPALRGEGLKKYVSAGISTDHECITLEEALEKIDLGMKIIIREGSAAKNYEALKTLLDSHPQQVMFCSDDKHPDDLLEGHMNKMARRALSDGFDFWVIIRALTLNPINHYKLKHGIAQVGEAANFIVLNDLIDFSVMSSYIKGNEVFNGEKISFELPEIKPINNFISRKVFEEEFSFIPKSNSIRVIEALDGELTTNTLEFAKASKGVNFESDIESDILKIVVINRYRNATPAVGFIKNFGLQKGAIASTVAHDSHNIIIVGTSDKAIFVVANHIMNLQGGIAVFNEEKTDSMALPIAGLMSDLDAEQVGNDYKKLDESAKKLGSRLHAPFMTLSFMALLVIPRLKISDLGLFDGHNFEFIETDLYH